MGLRSLLPMLCVATTLGACALLEDPRTGLGKLGVPYTADAFVGQAGQGDVKAVKLFLASGVAPDVKDSRGVNALANAAAGGHLAVVRLLLDKGASFEPRNPHGPTPLTAAAWGGHTEVVEALLAKGANPNTSDGSHQSALLLAVRGRHAPVVKLLLDKGARAWVQDDKWSALMLASFLGNMEVVRLLLAHNANVNAADDRGMTALMHAASTGHVDVVKALLAKGADVNAVDAGGQTALMFAANNGQMAVAAALRNAGADIDARNRNGSWPDDRARFTEAARIAWSFVKDRFQPATGLVTPLGGYPYTTMWDVGGMLAAVYSARGLGLLDEAGYQARVQAMLETLKRLPLYDNGAYSKAYNTRTGASAMAGWSTTDLGRLLIWLKIVGTDPRFQETAAAIVHRMDFSRLVRSGYLWGEGLDEQKRLQTYQEGTIGYEQYAAHGFALWGHRAEKALSLTENALPISVMGQPLVADFRRWDRLAPEPFLLWGLELGWDSQTAALVRRLLLAQEARYKKTGLVTIAGEDSLPLPPHWFYYYCVYANGQDFAIDVQDRRGFVDGPRWVSAKSAFAFHALVPTRYTDLALRTVTGAHTTGGWASGVYEGSGKSTGAATINTAGVILTAALFNQEGESLLARARRLSSH